VPPSIETSTFINAILLSVAGTKDGVSEREAPAPGVARSSGLVIPPVGMIVIGEEQVAGAVAADHDRFVG
jgi:hypothetical protein